MSKLKIKCLSLKKSMPKFRHFNDEFLRHIENRRRERFFLNYKPDSSDIHNYFPIQKEGWFLVNNIVIIQINKQRFISDSKQSIINFHNELIKLNHNFLSFQERMAIEILKKTERIKIDDPLYKLYFLNERLLFEKKTKLRHIVLRRSMNCHNIDTKDT